MKKYGKILLGVIIWILMMPGCVCTARADDAHSHEGWTKWTSANSLPGEAGKYYLNNDVTLTSEWIVPTGETSLCLNGHKIELGSDITDGTRCVIRVYYGATFNLFDCDQTVHKYSINANHIAVLDDNGSKSFTGGYITSNGGDMLGIALGDASNAVPDGYETFNMYGGTVFGNGNGGVTLDFRGTFNMHGGEIIGNKAMWGAGAAVYSFSSMTMSGGKIRDNYSYSDKNWGGGGVFLGDSFTMTGGEISNNTAVWGGGVYNLSEEPFKMTGGTIIGNTAAMVGGGVYLDGDLDISGNPRLKGNKAGNHADNIYCSDSGKINVSGVLNYGDSIGVTMQTPGVFTSGYRQKMGSADPAKFFHSDSSEYHVKLNGNEAGLSEGHEHRIIYTANGNTITATCTYSGCTLATNPATLTINAPALTIYGGTESAEATITDADGIRGDAAVKYYKADEKGNKDGKELGAPPASAGKYRAEITLGSGNNTATAYVVYKIVKEPVTIDVGSVCYVGEDIVITLTVPSDAAGPVAVSVDGMSYAVSDDLKVTIAGGLPEGNHTVTASLKYKEVDVTATKDFAVQKYGTSITVSADNAYFGEIVTVSATVSNYVQGKVVFYLDDSVAGTEGVINNMTATCTFSGLPAGKHSVKAVLDDLYYTAEPKTADFNVSKAPISPKISILGWTYGDAANTPTVEDYPGDGSISYTYTGIDTAGTAYSSDQPPVNAGAYTITATIPETDNYKGKTVANSFTIATKGVPLVWGNTNLVYSGEAQMPTASVEGLVGSDTCSVNVSGAQTNANAEGQKYTASLGDPQIDNPNYSINTDNATVEFTISPKSITSATVTLDDDELTYNTFEQPVSVSAVKIGNLIVDTYDMSGDTSGTNAGTYSLTVTGTGNFKDSATAEWKIIEKDMTVSAADVTAEYDGQPHGIIVTVTDPASGVDIKYGRTEGTYDLDASPTITDCGVLTIYYKVTSANYNVYTGSATVTITKKQTTVTAANQTIKEGENIQTGIAYATLTGAVSGHELGSITLTPLNGEIIASAALVRSGVTDVTDNYNITYEPGTISTLRRISAIVIFKVVNGEWNTGGSGDKAVTLTGFEGETLKLAAADIPAVGTKPDENYEAGSWNAVPSSETAITADITYTYTYAAKAQPILDKTALKIALDAGLKVSWKGSKITVEYGKVPGATSYEIYASYCGTADSFKKVKTTKKNRISIKKLRKKKLDRTKCVKIYLVAKNGDTKLAKSLLTHVAGPDGRYTSAKEIKLKKKFYSLKKGKKAKIKAEVISFDSSKELLPKSYGAKLRYASSDENVACVKNGKIKAKGTGNCTIYVYAINGFPQKINVTVK